MARARKATPFIGQQEQRKGGSTRQTFWVAECSEMDGVGGSLESQKKKKVINPFHLMSHFAKVRGWKASSHTTFSPHSRVTCNLLSKHHTDILSPRLTWNDPFPCQFLKLSERKGFSLGEIVRGYSALEVFGRQRASVRALALLELLRWGWTTDFSFCKFKFLSCKTRGLMVWWSFDF